LQDVLSSSSFVNHKRRAVMSHPQLFGQRGTHNGPVWHWPTLRQAHNAFVLEAESRRRGNLFLAIITLFLPVFVPLFATGKQGVPHRYVGILVAAGLLCGILLSVAGMYTAFNRAWADDLEDRLRLWSDDWTVAVYSERPGSLRLFTNVVARFLSAALIAPKLGFISIGLLIALLSGGHAQLTFWVVGVTVGWFVFRLPVSLGRAFGNQNRVPFLVARWPRRTVGPDGSPGGPEHASILLTLARNGLPSLLLFWIANSFDRAADVLADRTQGLPVVWNRIGEMSSHHNFWTGIAVGLMYGALTILVRLVKGRSTAGSRSSTFVEAQVAIRSATRLVAVVLGLVLCGFLALVSKHSVFAWRTLSSATAGLGISTLVVSLVLAARSQARTPFQVRSSSG
jgi:hypothetical protein